MIPVSTETDSAVGSVSSRLENFLDVSSSPIPSPYNTFHVDRRIDCTRISKSTTDMEGRKGIAGMAPPPPKKQRFMDSFVKRGSLSSNALSVDHAYPVEPSVLGRKTAKEFKDYMSSKYSMLRLDTLPHVWFKIIFDQKNGEDGGVERLESEVTACNINEALSSEKRLICPQPLENMWKWATTRPDPNDVRVVLVGQDPYHTVARPTGADGEPITMADGLAFSVNPEYAKLGKCLPPTLINIMKLADASFESRKYDDTRFHGSLVPWVESGVLLLNSALTTVEETPNAHKYIGWDKVTDRILEWLGRKSADETHTRIFMLWGKEANSKSDRIDRSTHVVITSCHPSPLSAYKYGWFDKDVFKEANLILRALGRSPICWSCRQEPPCQTRRRTELYTAGDDKEGSKDTLYKK